MGSIIASNDDLIYRNNGEVLHETAIQELKTEVKCKVLVRGWASADEYRAAVDRWNQTGVQEAAIIVFCESVIDVSTCLKWVKTWGLDIAIAGGRHTFHQASSTEGLVIDMRKMNKVSVDKDAKTVTAGGGCVAEDVEKAAESEGLSVVMGTNNDTGIGGLTLGGGSGWLTGQYGHTIDTLLSARVAVASGAVVTASEKENPDLFWGIRGGGSNFGVCTEFTYRALNQNRVFFGLLFYTADKSRECLELLNTFYKDAIEPSGGKFQLYLGFLTPPGGEAACPLYLVFYNGPEEEGRAYAAPLYALGPWHDTTAMTNYAAVNGVHKTMKVGETEHRRYTSSAAQMELPLDTNLLMDLVDDFRAFQAKYGDVATPSKLAIELRSFAVTGAVPVSAMAYASRHMMVNIVLEAQYNTASLDSTMREETMKIIGRLRRSINENRDPQTRNEVLVNANFAGGYEKLNAVFGENLPKLRALKRKYDPDFVFNKWYPIPPSEDDAPVA